MGATLVPEDSQKVFKSGSDRTGRYLVFFGDRHATLCTMKDTTEAMRKLGIEHSFIQGPFGGGLSSAALAAAVANRGSLGSFGCQLLDVNYKYPVTTITIPQRSP